METDAGSKDGAAPLQRHIVNEIQIHIYHEL